ncbi:MAG: hypothetical protein M1820_003230 [Bogoriella megaspora]|nr:MAG: hypothetical protein M1820_003230 [Bogoriella megaspora]
MQRPKSPLVAVIGATGTGKSQLAVEIAKRFNGEIINADAMQLYEEFPIITNKMSAEEQEGVPHHLLGQIDLGEKPWTVGKYLSQASSIIENIHSRQRLPILVGGTHYYTQSLLFEGSTIQDDLVDGSITDDVDSEFRKKYPILLGDTPSILARLREVDPIMADRWHPNDRRKIQRSLEIWLQTGRPASQIYQEQANGQISRGGECDSNLRLDQTEGQTMRLRYSTLIFWVHAEGPILAERLNHRADKMIESGLLDEVDSLEARRTALDHQGSPPDLSTGIWQAIGYRQLAPYSSAQTALTSPPHVLKKLLAEGLEQIKGANRRYAKTQVRWIRIKFMHALNTANAMRLLYLLDATDTNQWAENVRGRAERLMQQFLDGAAEMPLPDTLSKTAANMLQPLKEDLRGRPNGLNIFPAGGIERQSERVSKPNERLNMNQRTTPSGSPLILNVKDKVDDRLVAIKILMAKHAATADNELAIYRRLADTARNDPLSKHMLPLLDHFIIEGPNGIHACLVHEPMGCTAAALTRHLECNQLSRPGSPQCYPKLLAKKSLRDTISGIAFLHKNGVVHGDLQPGNILFSIIDSTGTGLLDEISEDAKITETLRRLDGKVDSGITGGATSDDHCDSTCASSPRVDLEQSFDSSIDIWAFGCLIYEFLTGVPLFAVWCIGDDDEDQTDDDHLLDLNNIIRPLPNE